MSWVEYDFLSVRGLPPEGEPVSYPDLAPFPLWLIPPAERCARMLDIVQAIRHYQATRTNELDGVEHPQEITVEDLGNWFERFDMPWNEKKLPEQWCIHKTGELLIVWESGKRASDLVQIPVEKAFLGPVLQQLNQWRNLPFYGVRRSSGKPERCFVEISNRESDWLQQEIRTISEMPRSAEDRKQELAKQTEEGDSYPITSIGIEDLQTCGFVDEEISYLADFLPEIARRMAEVYLETRYWDDLQLIARMFLKRRSE